MFQELNVNIRAKAMRAVCIARKITEEQARNLYNQHEEVDVDQLDYQGGDEAAGFMPFASAPEAGPRADGMQYSSGGRGPDDGPKLNRADRRRREKLAKKGRRG